VIAVLLVVVGAGYQPAPVINHAPKVKPEAATAVVKLLMMDVRTLKTRWAVNKCKVINLERLLHLTGDLFELYDDDARTCKD